MAFCIMLYLSSVSMPTGTDVVRVELSVEAVAY